MAANPTNPAAMRPAKLIPRLEAPAVKGDDVALGPVKVPVILRVPVEVPFFA
jgi:hypothetical protein